MAYYYGHGLGRVNDRQLAELNALSELLRRARYKRTREYAARLFKEGIGPEELRQRLRNSPADLKRTHGFERYTPRTLPRYKPGPFVGPESVAIDYKRLARNYLREARMLERLLREGVAYGPDKGKQFRGEQRARMRREVRHLRELARRALERARRHRGVYSRDQG